MKSAKVRTRFAPSPTGLLHVGGIRTALFSYLFAKHYQGEFVVRFEDTDLARNDPNVVAKQLQDLRWLGIEIDATVDQEDRHGPYQQSKRLVLYQEHAQKLLQQKKAYYCFCSKEELAVIRKQQLQQGYKAPKYNRKCWHLSPLLVQQNLQKQKAFCIRLKIPSEQTITFTDLVYGHTTFSSNHIEDFILIKTNGYPTYNFAVVVDDHLMAITHVLRGSDHLTNTAKQIALYNAFQWSVPQMGHLTLLGFKDQKKMSKRLAQPTQYLDYYHQKGYLPHAVFNYLALLGWTPDKFQEIFVHPKELIAKFDGNNLNKAQSNFSLVKLDWINHKHLVQLPVAIFVKYALPFCQQIQQQHNIPLSQLKRMIAFFQKEIRCFSQLPDLISNIFFPKIVRNDKQLSFLQTQTKLLQDFLMMIRKVSWNENALKQHLLILSRHHNLVGKAFFLPLRLAVSNLADGPQMATFLFFLGREQIIRNVSQQLSWM